MNNKSTNKIYFNQYNQLIEKLNNKFDFIDKKRQMDLSSAGLSDADKVLILNFLAQKKPIGNADAGDFEDVLDIIFEDKTQLVEFLQEISLQVKNPVVKTKIKKLLEIVFNKAASDAHIDLETNKYKDLSKSWKYPYNGSLDIKLNLLEKLYERRKFFFNRTLDENYFPTKAPHTNDKFGFENLNLEELQACFSPSTFYSLPAEAIPMLSQALVNKFCEANGIPSCAVDFNHIPNKGRTFSYGVYHVNKGFIEINKNFISNFSKAKDGNNSYFPLQLLSTLVHEAKHRVQFTNLNNDSTSAKEDLIKQSILHPNCINYLKNSSSVNSEKFAKYLSEPDEMDARNTSLEFIQSMAANNRFITNKEDAKKIAAFYNHALKNENCNTKLEYRDEYKSLFPQIYNGQPFDLKDRSLQKEMDAEYGIMTSLIKYGTMSKYSVPFSSPTF